MIYLTERDRRERRHNMLMNYVTLAGLLAVIAGLIVAGHDLMFIAKQVAP